MPSPFSCGIETSTRVAEEIRLADGRALLVQTDVSRAESVQKAVEQVRSELGRITILAYNAIGYGRGAFLELDPKIIQQSFDVRVRGALYLSQAVIPDMLKAATAALDGRAPGNRQSFVTDARSILARRVSSERNSCCYLIVDGQIDTLKLRARDPNRAAETIISPDSIAEIVLFTLKQAPDAWTHELDLTPQAKSF